MSIVSDSLGILDQARGLLDDVGLRPFRVFVRKTEFKETNELGLGDKKVTTTEITVDGDKRPKVRQLSAKEIVASGGQLSDLMFEVGPLTPPFVGGGVDASTITPAVGRYAAQIDYIVKGPGMPEEGGVFTKVSDDFSSPFRYMFTIRKTGA